MFLKKNFFLFLIFMAVLIIFPAQPVLADEESENNYQQSDEDSEVEDLEEQIEEYKKSLENDPQNAIYHNDIGWLYLRNSDFVSAKGHFQEAMDINPDYSDPFRGMGYVYYLQGKQQESKNFFIKSGQKCFETGNFEQAIEDLGIVIEIDDTNAEAYNYMGRVYFQTGNYNDAEGALSKAVELDNNYYEAYRWRGETYLKLDNAEKALEDFKTFLAIGAADIDNATKKYYEEKIKEYDPQYNEEYTEDTSDEEYTEEDSGEYLNEDGIFGEVNKLLKVLLFIMAIEYATTIACSIHERNFTFGGVVLELFLRMIILVIVVIANAFDESMLIDFEIRNISIAVILVYEFSALIDGVERLGAPVPEWLKNLAHNIQGIVKGTFDKLLGRSSGQQ